MANALVCSLHRKESHQIILRRHFKDAGTRLKASQASELDEARAAHLADSVARGSGCAPGDIRSPIGFKLIGTPGRGCLAMIDVDATTASVTCAAR